MAKLTENFHSEEFACPCCGKSEMNIHTVERLQRIRDIYGKPIRIVQGGGFRCRHYHEGGPLSAHLTGEAVDLDIPQADLYMATGLAFMAGFSGIGVKNRQGRWQLHIDDAEQKEGRPRPWIWSYQ